MKHCGGNEKVDKNNENKDLTDLSFPKEETDKFTIIIYSPLL